MTFETLGLHTSILRAIADTGYTTPTAVQQQAVPAAIAGRDLLVSSQTGFRKNGRVYAASFAQICSSS